MNGEVKSALKNAINSALPILQPLASQYTEPQLVWHKGDNQSWHGEYKDYPSLRQIFMVMHSQIDAIGMSSYSHLENIIHNIMDWLDWRILAPLECCKINRTSSEAQ